MLIYYLELIKEEVKMLTDLEIAQQAEILKIKEIAKKVNLSEDDLEL